MSGIIAATKSTLENKRSTREPSERDLWYRLERPFPITRAAAQTTQGKTSRYWWEHFVKMSAKKFGKNVDGL